MMNESELLEFLTQPSDRLVEDIKKMDSDIMILGCGGKIGPSLAIMANRAMKKAGLDYKVVGVSIFDDREIPEMMKAAGVVAIEADLSDPEQLASLPAIKNIIFMAGRKFGTYADPSSTWAINVLVPAKVCEAFPKANIVAFSTGNIYPYVDIRSGGACEDEIPMPVGEYGQTALGRERVFEYYAGINKNNVLLFRLNYAIDLRYGVLYDLAKNIMDGKPVNTGIGYFNCIWQGDVCEYAIRSLLYCSSPPLILNVSGPESISIRWAARTMGQLLGLTPIITEDSEPEKALFSNTARMTALMGYPRMPLLKMMEMVAEWVKSGGSTINAPTHFETTDGQF